MTYTRTDRADVADIGSALLDEQSDRAAAVVSVFVTAVYS